MMDPETDLIPDYQRQRMQADAEVLLETAGTIQQRRYARDLLHLLAENAELRRRIHALRSRQDASRRLAEIFEPPQCETVQNINQTAN